MTIINKQQKQKIKQLARKKGLNFVVLFGSAARKTTHKESDLDLAIKTKKTLSYLNEARLREQFCQILNKPNIEITSISGLSPLLMFEMAKDGKIIYESRVGDFAKFQMYAFKRYVEAKPLYQLKQKQLQTFLA